MTEPRQNLYPYAELCQRTVGDQFLLRLCPKTTRVFQHSLAIAAARTGVSILSAVLMSTHYHVLIYSPRLNAPKFLQILNSLVAREMNRMLDRVGQFWSNTPPSIIPILSRETLIERYTYIATNPVRAGIIGRAREFPALIASAHNMQATVQATLPAEATGTQCSLNLTASFIVDVPYEFLDEHESVEQFSLSISAHIHIEEERLRRVRRTSGKHFMGLRVASQESRYKRPSARALRRLRESRGIPAYLEKDRDKLQQLLAQRCCFRRSYRRAWLDWKAGDADVIFPPGTYKLCALEFVNCDHVPHPHCIRGLEALERAA